MMEHVVLDMELWSMLSTDLQQQLLGWLSMLAENLHQKCNMLRFKQVCDVKYTPPCVQNLTD